MRSLRTRVETLQRAVEAATARDTVILVLLIVVSSRAEAEALRRLDETEPHVDRPQARGLLRLEIQGTMTATEYLADRGVTLPASKPLSQPEALSEGVTL